VACCLCSCSDSAVAWGCIGFRSEATPSATRQHALEAQSCNRWASARRPFRAVGPGPALCSSILSSSAKPAGSGSSSDCQRCARDNLSGTGCQDDPILTTSIFGTPFTCQTDSGGRYCRLLGGRATATGGSLREARFACFSSVSAPLQGG